MGALLMKTKHAYLTASIELEIPFFDVDSMEIAWHGHYLKYFEIARCALLDKLGYNYTQMAESGYAWPVIDIRVKYVKPARFKQKIIIEARLVEYENRLKIQYFIFDQLTGKRLTKGYSVQVAVNISNQEMCYSSPQILLNKITAHTTCEAAL